MSRVLDDKLLDISNWDWPTFDPACFAESGVRRVIVAGAREQTRTMIRRCQEEGIEVIGVYAFLYFGFTNWRDPRVQTEHSIAAAKEYGVPMVWLDCESTPGAGTEPVGQTPATRTAQLRECLRMVEDAGLQAGVYTAAWWWPTYMENTTEFARLPLWHAAYGPGSGPRDPVFTVAYGGWSDVAIHQYTSQLQRCGRNRDHNYLLQPIPARKSPMPEYITREEFEKHCQEELAQLNFMWHRLNGASLARFAVTAEAINIIAEAMIRAQAVAAAAADPDTIPDPADWKPIATS